MVFGELVQEMGQKHGLEMFSVCIGQAYNQFWPEIPFPKFMWQITEKDSMIVSGSPGGEGRDMGIQFKWSHNAGLYPHSCCWIHFWCKPEDFKTAFEKIKTTAESYGPVSVTLPGGGREMELLHGNDPEAF